ncbi:MAG TPA: trypsin-like peptidase domain-containing protein [Actinomycetota bacterium]|jgi:S1-C subfamily serine protease
MDLEFVDSPLGPQPTRTLPAQDIPSEHEALDAYSNVVTTVAERLGRSVASLGVVKRIRGRRSMEGSGSGVVITPDGFMLTSAHVVQDADRGTATFVDGREVGIEIVGTDPLSDMAVIRASGDDFIPAPLGDAARLKVGQLVVAIGNPLGFSGSVTAGVVSALDRSFATQSGSATRFVENVIQTDAALHPGNSGGALADGFGRVVGINTALIGPGVGQGLGLAVPINDAMRQIISALMADGRVRRAYLGVAGGPRPLPPKLARAIGRERGVEVVQVLTGSPAEKAGLRSEDLILEVNGVEVAGADDLQRMMDVGVIGRRIPLTVYRHGETMTIHVRPAELS